MTALAVVTALAILGPLVVFFATRSSDSDTVAVDAQQGVETVPTPSTAPSTADTTVGSMTDTGAAAPVAPAPTAISASAAATPASAPAAAPVVTQLAGEAPAVYKVTGLAAGSALNVRQSAGTTNPLIGTLASDATRIAATGRRVTVDGSEWREIRFKEGTGWVFAGYLALAPVPVSAATPTPAPTATPEAIKALSADAPGIFRITGLSPGSSLNVRAEPGRTQRLLGTLPGDTAALPSTGERSLVGQTEWREIGFRDGTGWVDATFLTLVPEAPKTVLLPTVAPSTVGIVALTTPNDRLVLRADPGYDQAIVGTVGGSSVNITATGRLAQIETQSWAEVTTSGTTGWVPRQLINPAARTTADVLATSGVAAVSIDKVIVAEDGTVAVQIGQQTVKVAANTTVLSETGSPASIADWSAATKTSTTAIAAEVTVVGNQITRIWVAS